VTESNRPPEVSFAGPSAKSPDAKRLPQRVQSGPSQPSLCPTWRLSEKVVTRFTDGWHLVDRSVDTSAKTHRKCQSERIFWL